MVTCYFGLPGCGKSTFMAKIAQLALRKMEKRKAKGKKTKYDHVYSNVYIEGTEKIDPMDLGRYRFYKSLILIDEITLVWDSRNHKHFAEKCAHVLRFFMTHRHYKCDVIYFTQYYKNVDKRIRDVTAKTFKVERRLISSKAWEVPEGIVIPVETGEIKQGHHMPGKLKQFLFAKRCLLFRWFKYFNSFSEDELPEYKVKKWLPDEKYAKGNV
jgi:hypothetical protein